MLGAASEPELCGGEERKVIARRVMDRVWAGGVPPPPAVGGGSWRGGPPPPPRDRGGQLPNSSEQDLLIAAHNGRMGALRHPVKCPEGGGQ
jgi:hypothetical protein